jgi:hypothetical protein
VDFGEVPVVDLREMEIYDRTRRFQLVLRDNGEMEETDQSDSFHRLMWNLGPECQVEVTQSDDLRQIVIQANGVQEAGRPQESHWSHTMTFLPR